ncbi:recombinase family protein [Microbispora cellulosiformans]|uniref:Recombinase family protein n=1 Tax=Microbispora cellulosiformans TaxID=2614688 RepID=A0A5J5K8E5_9ACTN|nr:recombinase family protein [Microbispora cellulosiformans]KAA9379729.1 recombinase family protein [Microbispora cellulosiformans]
MSPIGAGSSGLRWGIYARLSMDRQGSGLAVERQIAECTDLLHLIDPQGVIVDVYVDNDISASKKKWRPDYERMIKDVEGGRINALAVWHIDRLTRRNAELERVVELIESKRAFFKCVHGDVDLSTHTGRMVARILGAVAQGEVEQKAARQKSANRQSAAKGKTWSGGMRRYGYEADGVTLVPDEVKVVRHMVEHVLKGGSVRSLVDWLDKNGHKTTQGNPWLARGITRLLVNPAMAGHRTYLEAGRPEEERQIVARDVWPAIITDDEQRRLEVILRDPARVTNREGNSRKYLLGGGVLICGLCGRALAGHRSNSGKPGYNCRKSPPYSGCGRIRIAAGPLEVDVAGQVLARFASPAIRRRLAKAVTPEGEDATLGQEMTDLQEKLEQLGRDYADPEVGLPREAFVAASRSLKARLVELKAKVKQAQRFEALPENINPRSLAEWWADAEMEQQRMLVLTVLEHIVVHPSTRIGFQGLDPDRLTYVWR